MEIHRLVTVLAAVMMAFTLLVASFIPDGQTQMNANVLQARDDNAVTDEDKPVIIKVLANDNFGISNGNIVGLFKVTSVTKPTNGDAVINSDNSVTYKPKLNFFGADSFMYTVSDRTGLLTGKAAVRVTVNPVNDSPVAKNDFATTTEETSISIKVLANDSDVEGDRLRIVAVTQSVNGICKIFSNLLLTYTPNRDFRGTDSFSYIISDGKGGTARGRVEVTVNSASEPGFAISKKSSGLIASDALTEPKRKEQLKAGSYWTFDGSAARQNAPYDYFQDSQGMHIGTQAVASGIYAGYFAMSPSTDGILFHAVVTTPFRTVPADFFQNGLYVQTVHDIINYVTCVAITSTTGTTWHIVHATGNTVEITDFKTLWSDPGADQPLTRDCTIITNGHNYLKVYLDNVLVYENNQLDLKMPPPFLYFLEPQNSHPAMLYGIYKDYYATLDENIKIVNVPSNAATVKLVDSTGKVLASASVMNGDAVIKVGQYHFPLAAHIKLYDDSGAEIVSTATPTKIVGGDVYSVDRV